MVNKRLEDKMEDERERERERESRPLGDSLCLSVWIPSPKNGRRKAE